MDRKNNSIVFRLKGSDVICPVLTLPLTEVLEINGLVCKGEQIVGVCDEFLKCVRVHLKNGVILSFFEWYEDDSDFADEPLAGFSGPEHIRMRIILKLGD